METLEENSIDWNRGREEFEIKGTSFRKIGDILHLSHTAVAKKAKKEGWKRRATEPADCKPRCKPEIPQVAPSIDAATRVVAAATVSQLTARGRNIILALMDELEFLNRHADVLGELVANNFNGEKEAGTRAKLLKALDHETRTKSSNQLATALAKLNDAAPGKKEQAQADAETAGQGSGWGDDLDTGVTGRPN